MEINYKIRSFVITKIYGFVFRLLTEKIKNAFLLDNNKEKQTSLYLDFTKDK